MRARDEKGKAVLGKPNGSTVSVVVVNWNTRESLLACLDSLEAALHHLPNEIIVIDNASTDGSAEAVMQRFPRVHLVRNSRNRGFSGGVNDGLARAGGENFLVLNPDIEVDRKTMDRLLEVLNSDRSIGAVVPVLRTEDGRVQRGYVRRLPSVIQTLLFDTQMEGWSMRRPGLVHRYREQPLPAPGSAGDVEQIPGAFILTRRDVIQRAGGFDEEFPLFFEDVDWSLRARMLGYRLVCVPEVSAVHAGGKSFTAGDTTWLLGRFRASQVLYFRKHASLPAALAVRMIHLVNSAAVILRKSIAMHFGDREARERACHARTQHLRLLRLLLAPGADGNRGLPS